MAKSLKDQNNWRLWLIVVANAIFFYVVQQANEMRLDGLPALFKQIPNLLPIGLAGVVATVLNTLPTAELKATIVYWRWNDALPGHRAFSKYVGRDSRIDQGRLLKAHRGKFPIAPTDQNAAWYKIYKVVRSDVMILDSNRIFLLLRDYASLSFLFVFIFGSAAFYLIESKIVVAQYLGVLILQYLIARIAAANAGVRLVTNVLALKTATGR
ncbi:hypothetical protein [Methylobacterium haplocladii]|uniref:Uncharacterized protein n=1 Tax=Methylobacterium haplocladii TaxID=1176176 RepID=A0A512IST6_9HYPH|nr:hypothetical protein [Methylobacterium haplocladii]GEP00726.1 hypothetical protein MHA02_31130 [Methylobacterium haplocladii]GJD82419.1 hypothetical protein HPGCJGGD_0273 [Methylobacterium haplocladii]GLS59547.1 hypothetical protein GCM10007887_22160 [Methylobacterium haplocladii]